MSKKSIPEISEEDLAENEEFISDDDLDLEVRLDPTNNSVTVVFTGFGDTEDAEEYAEMLANTLPLLLFESIRVQ
jgi:hypothetical protein